MFFFVCTPGSLWRMPEEQRKQKAPVNRSFSSIRQALGLAGWPTASTAARCWKGRCDASVRPRACSWLPTEGPAWVSPRCCFYGRRGLTTSRRMEKKNQNTHSNKSDENGPRWWRRKAAARASVRLAVLSRCRNGGAHHPSPEGGSTSGDGHIVPHAAAAALAPHLHGGREQSLCQCHRAMTHEWFISAVAETEKYIAFKAYIFLYINGLRYLRLPVWNMGNYTQKTHLDAFNISNIHLNTKAYVFLLVGLFGNVNIYHIKTYVQMNMSTFLNIQSGYIRTYKSNTNQMHSTPPKKPC